MLHVSRKLLYYAAEVMVVEGGSNNTEAHVLGRDESDRIFVMVC